MSLKLGFRNWLKWKITVPGTPEGCALDKHDPVCVDTEERDNSNPKLARYGFKNKFLLYVCRNPDCKAERWISEKEQWHALWDGDDHRILDGLRN